ncbi:MAG: hypothetical protein GY772_21640 [bacterium]|nr:hypothetical protein [bacterium]
MSLFKVVLMLCVVSFAFGISVGVRLSSAQASLKEYLAKCMQQPQELEGEPNTVALLEAPERDRQEVRHVKVQAPDSYLFWLQKPRFKPLAERDHGAWHD